MKMMVLDRTPNRRNAVDPAGVYHSG